MRHLKFLLLMCSVVLLGMSGVGFTQTDVTFTVDMSVHIALGNFDSATQGVSAVGSHNGWGEGVAAGALSDADGDGIYSGTIPVAQGDIQYKYVVSADGAVAAWESSPDRTLTVGADPVSVDTTEWAQGILFKVDMTPPLAGGATLDTTTQYVAVVGSHNGWGDAPRESSEMSDADGDNIYEGRHEVGSAEVLYKFTIRNQSDNAVVTWENHPDRTLDGVSIDPVETTVVPWDGDAGETVDVNVTFNCDMSVHIGLGNFDPATQGISQVGSHNGWEKC